MRKSIFALAVALFCTPLLPASAAPVSSKQNFDVRAVALLNQSARAYAGLKGLSMHFSTSSRYRYSRRKDSDTTMTNGGIAFSRPGRAKVTWKLGTKNLIFQSDGTQVFTLSHPESVRYARGEKAMKIVFEGIPTVSALVLRPFLMGDSLMKEKEFRWEKISLLPGRGVAMRGQYGEFWKTKVDVKLYFDPSDHLIRRITIAMKQKDVAAEALALTTLTNVRINPTFAPDTFALKPVSNPRMPLQKRRVQPKDFNRFLRGKFAQITLFLNSPRFSPILCSSASNKLLRDVNENFHPFSRSGSVWRGPRANSGATNSSHAARRRDRCGAATD